MEQWLGAKQLSHTANKAARLTSCAFFVLFRLSPKSSGTEQHDELSGSFQLLLAPLLCTELGWFSSLASSKYLTDVAGLPLGAECTQSSHVCCCRLLSSRSLPELLLPTFRFPAVSQREEMLGKNKNLSYLVQPQRGS